MAEPRQNTTFTYSGTITIDVTCKETGKPFHTEKPVTYVAGSTEPDAQKLTMKLLRKGGNS